MIDRQAIETLARNIEQHAFRRGYVSAFTLAAYPVESAEELTLHVTRECDGLVYGNAEVGTEEALQTCIEVLDGRVDYIMYDIGLFGDVAHPQKVREYGKGKSALLPYSDQGVWVASVRHTLLALVPDLALTKMVIVATGRGEDSLSARLVMDLAWYCRDIWVYNVDEPAADEEAERADIFKDSDIIIGAAVYRQVVTVENIVLTGRQPLVVDAGIGTITPEAAQYARSHGLRIIRVDNRAAMAGTLFSIIQSHDLVTRVMGEGLINEIPVVAGGIVGAPGTVILDSINNPAQVIGIADGTGKVHYQPANDEERKRLDSVMRAVERDAVD